MGREKDPFDRRGQSQGRKRREHEDEHDLYDDDLDDFDEEYEVEDREDFDERGLNVPRIRTAPPLPPFPSSTRNRYPRTSRASRMSEPTTSRPRIRPVPTARPKRHASPPNEPQPLPRRSTESYQQPPRQRTRTYSDIPDSGRRVPSRPHKHRVWPIFLGGCTAGAVSLILAIAIIVWIGIQSVQKNDLGLNNDGQAITGKSETQVVPLQALSQLIVCDPAGDVSLSVASDSNANGATVTTTKTALHAIDQKDADQKLSQISVSVQAQPPGQTLACDTLQANNTSPSNSAPTTTPTATNNSVLSVNVVFPSNQVSQTATVQTGQTPVAQAGQNAKVDVTIVLPKSVVQLQQDPTSTLISMPNEQGSIAIDGVSGKMDVQDASGDITVKNGRLVDGSKLQAREGKVTFNGSVWPNPTPQSQRASLFFSGAYMVDIILLETSSVMIDATTNTRTGTITSDFSISVVDNNDGSHTYYGPFNPAIQPDAKTAPRLTLQSSSGNIALHKERASQSTP